MQKKYFQKKARFSFQLRSNFRIYSVYIHRFASKAVLLTAVLIAAWYNLQLHYLFPMIYFRISIQHFIANMLQTIDFTVIVSNCSKRRNVFWLNWWLLCKRMLNYMLEVISSATKYILLIFKWF